MRIGIDLGGTKIEIMALDLDGAVTFRKRIPAPRGDYQATIVAIRELVVECRAHIGQDATIGVGIPGAQSKRSGLIKNANSTWLIGQPFKEDLEAALEQKIRIQNDANCFAVSEAIDGAAEGQSVVFGVILGTGVGAGIAIDGQVLTGRNAIAGEWGHNPLPWITAEDLPAHPCYCGLTGCVETYLSGPALQRIHTEVSGESITAEQIAERFIAGNRTAEHVIVEHADRLARALAHVINILDPDAIVLGGGLSKLPHLYDMVPSLWSKWVFSDEVDTPLLPPRHGDASGVRGAAWLWPRP